MDVSLLGEHRLLRPLRNVRLAVGRSCRSLGWEEEDSKLAVGMEQAGDCGMRCREASR